MVNKAYKCKKCQKVSKGKKSKGVTTFHKKHRCPGCGSFYFFKIDIFDGLIFDFEELVFDYEGEYATETPPEDYVEGEPLEDPEEATMMDEDLEADDPLRMDDAVETCGPDVEDEPPVSEVNSSEESFPSFPSSPSFEDDDSSKRTLENDGCANSGWGSHDSGSSSDSSSSYDLGSSYDSGYSCDSGSSDW